MKEFIPDIQGSLRKEIIRMPAAISTASGIRIFGKLIRSLIFTTDVAIIRNCNADAVIAVYPFTPQPLISHALIIAADIPVFCGVGGGTTTGKRVLNLAMDAEFQGAIGVVVNHPTQNDIIADLRQRIDVPIVVTVANGGVDISKRLAAGASILNVSAAGDTPSVVEKIRREYPEVPIIATGGPKEESIIKTIAAGANAITYTPPTSAEIFQKKMEIYRETGLV